MTKKIFIGNFLNKKGVRNITTRKQRERILNSIVNADTPIEAFHYKRYDGFTNSYNVYTIQFKENISMSILYKLARTLKYFGYKIYAIYPKGTDTFYCSVHFCKKSIK